MNPTPFRIDERNKNFQRDLDADDLKKRRDESVIELRKKKRIGDLVKRSRRTSDSPSLFSFDSSQIDSTLSKLDPRLLSASLSGTERISILINLISTSSDLQALTSSIELLRKLSSSENSLALEIIFQSGVAPKLVQCLSLESALIKYNTAWIFTNLSTLHSEVCMALAQQGAVEALAKVAASEVTTEHSHQALWALSNFAGDNAELRDKVFATGISDYIIRRISICQNIELNVLGTMIWLVSNLLKFRPFPKGNLVNEFFSLLPKLLPLSHEEILIDTLKTISYITSKGENLDLVFNSLLVGRIVFLLNHDSYKVKSCAIEIISNLTLADSNRIQGMIENNNLINLVFQTLMLEKKNLKKDCLFVLSNISNEHWELVQKIIVHKNFGEIEKCLDNPDKEVRIEALYVYLQLCKFGDHVFNFVHESTVERLLRIITYPDSESILVTLKIFHLIFSAAKENEYENIFKVFFELDGVYKVEKLQAHPDENVYKHTVSLLRDHIGIEGGLNGTFNN